MFQEIGDSLIAGNAEETKKLVQKALEAGYGAEEILDRGLLFGMSVVGQRFRAGAFYIPEVLLSARAMHCGLDILRPILTETQAAAKGKVLLGTVLGDLHDIGKNLVGMLLEGEGFKVLDVGTNVPAERFVDAVREHQPDLVGLSAMLTTTMAEMEKTVRALRNAGLDCRIKIIVGGAPVTAQFAEKIGADGYAEDAAEAVEVVRKLIGTS
jgi:5-methyltetrahydrofolate--homocysteine methyltransferase